MHHGDLSAVAATEELIAAVDKRLERCVDGQAVQIDCFARHAGHREVSLRTPRMVSPRGRGDNTRYRRKTALTRESSGVVVLARFQGICAMRTKVVPAVC